MKKEMFIAVLIGFLLGLAITFGVYRMQVAKKKNVMVDVPTQTAPASTPDTTSLLVIHSPDDGSIQTENEATITGTAVSGSHVVLFVNDTDYVRTTDDAGNFSFTVKLDDGPNILTITMVDQAGTSVTKQRTIVVTDLYERATSTETTTSTPSAETPKE